MSDFWGRSNKPVEVNGIKEARLQARKENYRFLDIILRRNSAGECRIDYSGADKWSKPEREGLVSRRTEKVYRKK